MFLILIVNILYALICPLGEIALRYTTPLFLTASRMLLAGFFVLWYQYTFRRSKFTFSRKNIWSLALASIFSIYLTNWLEFWGLKYLTPAKTTFLYDLYPFAAAILSYFFMHEKLSGKKWLGLAIGFLGSLPLLLEHHEPKGEFYKFLGFLSLPELAVLGAVFACPFGWIFIQKSICKEGYDAIMANGVTMFAGGIMALTHSFLTENWNPLPVTNMTGFLITTLAFIIISNIICNTLYIELLKKYSLTFLSFTSFTTAPITALFDWLIFGYTASIYFFLSSVIMFIGFYLFYKEELKQLRAKKT